MGYYWLQGAALRRCWGPLSSDMVGYLDIITRCCVCAPVDGPRAAQPGVWSLIWAMGPRHRLVNIHQPLKATGTTLPAPGKTRLHCICNGSAIVTQIPIALPLSRRNCSIPTYALVAFAKKMCLCAFL